MGDSKSIEPRLVRYAGVDQATKAHIYEGDIDGDGASDRVFVEEEALLDIGGTTYTLPPVSQREPGSNYNPKINFSCQFGRQRQNIFNDELPGQFKKANGREVKIGDGFVMHGALGHTNKVEGFNLNLQAGPDSREGEIPPTLLVGVYVMYGTTAMENHTETHLENVIVIPK